MKLIKKFLTASLPVALVGVMTPTIVSCSCSKKSFDYNYGDHINCRDKDDSNYHKRKDIANAARQKAYREPQGEISLAFANNMLTGETGGQFAFNELIASVVVTEELDINLDEWNYDDTTYKIQCDLWYGENHIPSEQDLTFTYVKDDQTSEIYLQIMETNKIRSYAFYDCTAQ